MDCNIDNDNDDDVGGVDVALLDASIHGSWNDYPVNELRNLALRAVRTTHILYLDVDFWPSEHLYDTIMGNRTRTGTTTTTTTGETNSKSNSNPASTSSWSEARIALFNDPKQALVNMP